MVDHKMSNIMFIFLQNVEILSKINLDNKIFHFNKI